MWRILFALLAVTASCEEYKNHHQYGPGRNQRSIENHGMNLYNDFLGSHHHPHHHSHHLSHHHPHHLPHHHSHYPPPHSPFAKGHSTNHIKHLSKPPPLYNIHKSPPKGHGSLHPTKINKDYFHLQTLKPFKPTLAHSILSTKPAKGHKIMSHSSSSGSHSSASHPHIQTLKPFRPPVANSILNTKPPKGQKVVSHPPASAFNSHLQTLKPLRPLVPDSILNTTPPKGQKVVFQSSASGSHSSASSSHSSASASHSSASASHSSDSFANTAAASNSIAFPYPSFGASSFSSSPIGHIITSDDNGPIREIPAPNLGPKPHGVSFNNIPHISTDSFVSSFGKDSGLNLDTSVNLNPPVNLHTGVNLDAIVKNPGVELNTYLKESSGDIVFGKEPTVEIANFDEGSSLDVTNLIKDAAVTSDHSEHSSGYEVTEHHNHLPSNDQIIKGHDGTKLYYAPDPDPSLPVHKVPPTNDPHSTPSNGQSINNLYIPQIPYGFPYLQGGAPAASLSSQELFHLMHGFPSVISQPVVAFVDQTQTPGVILPGGGHNYFQQGTGSPVSHFSQENHHNSNDISQYLAQSDIHNLLHHSDESHHEQDTLGSSQSFVVDKDGCLPQSSHSSQNNCQKVNYQSSYENTNPNSERGETYGTSDIDHNYQYEPEASESNIRNSLTVIRHTNEGSLNSETVKDLLLEDSASNDVKDVTAENYPTILQLNNIPEVPFYSSLPSKKAAEALASLQAAGSVASNYMKRNKITRGDQGSEEDEQEHIQGRLRKTEGEPKTPKYHNHRDDGSIAKGETIELGREKTVVEIQKSLPLYETSVSSRNLVDAEERHEDQDDTSNFSSEGQVEEDISNLDPKEVESNEAFGKRIRPK